MYDISFIHWNIDPVLFHIGPFPLRYYSILFTLGILLSYKILQRLYVGKSLTQPQLDKLLLYIVIGTLAGARLGHCLFYEPGYFLKHPWEIVLPFQIGNNGIFHFTGYQGLASHGGAIGILTAIALYAYKYHMPFLSVADKVALVTPVAGACIRIGNLFNSEIIGKSTDVPWAFIFEREDQEPRHPAQLYEAICYAILFLLLLRITHQKKHVRAGYLLGWFLVGTFVARFAIEFLKAPQEAFEENMFLDMGQILSLPFILMGFFLIYYKKERKQLTPTK